MTFHPYRTGDYTFTIGKPTGYGDEVTVHVTDTADVYCGQFYMDSADDETAFHETADEWLREEESPDAVYNSIFGRIV